MFMDLFEHMESDTGDETASDTAAEGEPGVFVEEHDVLRTCREDGRNDFEADDSSDPSNRYAVD